jgi:hypothetical protein
MASRPFESGLVVCSLEVLQDLQNIDDRLQLLRELDLRGGERWIVRIAAVACFCAFLRIPVALDRHEPLDRAEIDHHRDVAHPALPLVGHVLANERR